MVGIKCVYIMKKYINDMTPSELTNHIRKQNDYYRLKLHFNYYILTIKIFLTTIFRCYVNSLPSFPTFNETITGFKKLICLIAGILILFGILIFCQPMFIFVLVCVMFYVGCRLIEYSIK